MTALAITHKAEILEHVAQGGRLSELNLGVTPQAISKALKDDPDYQAAMISYHAARLDKAEKEIEGAIEQVDVARARALHAAYAWRAEREQRRIWGNDPAVVINTGVSIDQALGQAALTLLDQMRTVAVQPQQSQVDEG